MAKIKLNLTGKAEKIFLGLKEEGWTESEIFSKAFTLLDLADNDQIIIKEDKSKEEFLKEIADLYYEKYPDSNRDPEDVMRRIDEEIENKSQLIKGNEK